MLVEEARQKAVSSASRYVRGKGRYVDDIDFDDMLYLKVIRSPYARARITRVEGGINGHELNASMSSVGEGALSGNQGVNYPVLATNYVSYLGQPVAAVLGKDRYEAEDNVEQVSVEYEPLRPVIDPLSSPDQEPIHPNIKSNIMSESRLGKEFDLKAEVLVEDNFSCERIIPNPLEPRGIVAHYDGTNLNVYASTQSVHSWREGLSRSLKLSPEQVRVIQMDTGGAFGSKGGIYPEYVIACYASLKTKRPVKWIETRYEHLMATAQGRGVHASMKVYARRDGRILGLKSRIIVDAGAYPVGTGPWSPRWIGYQITGPYAIENLYVEAIAVYTNKVPLGPYRGAGRPEAAFFIERIIDKLSDEIKKDPLEVRLANTVDGKFVSQTGLEILDAKKFLSSAARRLGYSRLRKKKAGLSFFVLIPAVEPGETARIRVGDGIVKVWLGGSSHGQGHDEFARKIVSEELSVPIEKVYFENTDTAEMKKGVGSWGSRTALLAGAALVELCKKIREKARQKLGNRYKTDEFLNSVFDEEISYEPEGQMNSLGVNIATARKDKLGFAYIDSIMSYYDVGLPLNWQMIKSQVEGGSIQGLGQLLSEKAAYDENGQLLVSSISEAGLLKINSVPKFVTMLHNSKSKVPKGVGESPTIGVPPAAARAIELLTGRRVNHTPLSQEELFVGG